MRLKLKMAVRNITRGRGMRAHIQNTLPQAQPDGACRQSRAIFVFGSKLDLTGRKSSFNR